MIMTEDNDSMQNEEGIQIESDSNSVAAASRVLKDLKMAKKSKLENLANKLRQEEAAKLNVDNENGTLSNRIQGIQQSYRNELLEKMAYLYRLR